MIFLAVISLLILGAMPHTAKGAACESAVAAIQLSTARGYFISKYDERLGAFYSKNDELCGPICIYNFDQVFRAYAGIEPLTEPESYLQKLSELLHSDLSESVYFESLVYALSTYHAQKGHLHEIFKSPFEITIDRELEFKGDFVHKKSRPAMEEFSKFSNFPGIAAITKLDANKNALDPHALIILSYNEDSSNLILLDPDRDNKPFSGKLINEEESGLLYITFEEYGLDKGPYYVFGLIQKVAL